MRPTVSIVLSTYNRATKYLPRAIDSVLNQTYGDFELIVVDDCSPDNTLEVVHSYAERDKRVIYHRTEKQSGSDTNPKNQGILKSRGKYIAYLDDDNEYLPHHLEILVNRLEKNPDLDAVYCDMQIFDDANPGVQSMKAIALDFDAQFLINRNYIDTSEVMHRRDIVFKVGGWDETLPKFVDWNLWVRMVKAGAKFQRVPIVALNYYVFPDRKSNRHPTKSWVDPRTQMTMFEPTFDPAGCYIYLPHLGNDRLDQLQPNVGIFTITYDRLEYTKRMHASMVGSTKYPFSWFVFDNGSKDDTQSWVAKQTPYVAGGFENKGLTYASNFLVDRITKDDEYQIIIKVDNDCEFMTKHWLEHIVDLWKRNHMLYMSPYVEGLIHNPGGAPRVGHAFIGPYYVEVTEHIGGLFAAVDARAYREFRWQDQFLHGNQDLEASRAFAKDGFMPLYLPMDRVSHMDGTEAQHAKYPEYFKRRIKEKQTAA
jgi:glycosyltransferase involved in cell wall biosynthesis